MISDEAPGAVKEQKYDSYFGRKIAVDASMFIYSFLAVVGRQGQDTLTTETGEVTSHLQGMYYRAVRMLETGIKPVFVFEGKPPALKREELAKRSLKREAAGVELQRAIDAGDKEAIEKLSKRTIKVTPEHNEDCKKLLRLMGIPVFDAPSEAEAQCAQLVKENKCYGVSTVGIQTPALSLYHSLTLSLSHSRSALARSLVRSFARSPGGHGHPHAGQPGPAAQAHGAEERQRARP